MLSARSLPTPAPVAPGREQVPRIEPLPPQTRFGRGRFLWLLWALLLASAIGLLLQRREDHPLAPTAAVRSVAVRLGDLEQTIRLTGNTVARNSVHLRAPYLRGRRSGGSGDFGLALERLAASGTHLRKGDLVAAFDRMPMLSRLDDYRAARVDRELRLRTMRADLDVRRVAYQQQVRAAKARIDKAELDLKTAPVRSAIQAALLQLAFDEARASYQALLDQATYVETIEQAEMRLSQLELLSARVEERRAEANAEKMLARAPVEGLVMITEIFRGSEFGQIQVGDELRPGQPYGQIVDAQSIIVEASANQVDVESLRIGARAHLHFDAYSGLELQAHVYSVGPLAKARRWRTAYVSEVPVYLKLDRADPRLIPHLSVSAGVVLQREPNAGIIPRASVFHKTHDGRPYAYVRTSSGWEKRDVVLGLANNIDVVVRSGLRPGEIVALDQPSA